jgi:hypothetical protein
METTQNEMPKVYFVRVKAETYQQIVELAKKEDRSINNMTNLLLKRSLEE